MPRRASASACRGASGVSRPARGFGLDEQLLDRRQSALQGVGDGVVDVGRGAGRSGRRRRRRVPADVTRSAGQLHAGRRGDGSGGRRRSRARTCAARAGGDLDDAALGRQPRSRPRTPATRGAAASSSARAPHSRSALWWDSAASGRRTRAATCHRSRWVSGPGMRRRRRRGRVPASVRSATAVRMPVVAHPGRRAGPLAGRRCWPGREDGADRHRRRWCGRPRRPMPALSTAPA